MFMPELLFLEIKVSIILLFLNNNFLFNNHLG